MSSVVCPVSFFVDFASSSAVVSSPHSLFVHCSSVFWFLCRASGSMSWSCESSPLRSASPARVLSVAMFSMVSILLSLSTVSIDACPLCLSILCGAAGDCGLIYPVSLLCTSVSRCVSVGIVDVSSGFTGVACCTSSIVTVVGWCSSRVVDADTIEASDGCDWLSLAWLDLCWAGQHWYICLTSPHPYQVAGCPSYESRTVCQGTVKWDGTCWVIILVTCRTPFSTAYL